MFMTLKRAWPALDATGGKKINVTIPAGRHQIQKVPNPLEYEGPSWLVLKGTLIGASESSWRQWQNGSFTINIKSHPDFGKPVDWGDNEVVIED